MTRIGLALAAAAILALAQPASAADMPGAPPLMRAPSAIVASNWAGLYVGGHAGYSWAKGEYILNDGLMERFGIDAGGFMGGGQIGAQAQWGHYVFGVEGTYSWADLSEVRTSTLVPGNTASFDTRYIGTVVGKFGYAMDRWLAYGKGGIAWARVQTLDVAPGLTFDSSVWETGYTLGFGLEYMWLPNWVVGLEFDYYGFTFNRQLAGGGVTAAIHDSNADIYAVMLRLNYLFNTRW